MVADGFEHRDAILTDVDDLNVAVGVGLRPISNVTRVSQKEQCAERPVAIATAIDNLSHKLD